MLATCIHLMRGTPYIYQGEELGMTNPHYREISQYRDVESLNYYEILLKQGKTEKEALEILAARSRDNARTPMQWSGEKNAGFTKGTPWIEPAENYETINVRAEAGDEASVLSYYKKLIALRKGSKVISEGKITFLEKENEGILAYRRDCEGSSIAVFNNLTAEETEAAADGTWAGYRKILGNYEDGEVGTDVIRLRPYESIVLEKNM